MPPVCDTCCSTAQWTDPAAAIAYAQAFWARRPAPDGMARRHVNDGDDQEGDDNDDDAARPAAAATEGSGAATDEHSSVDDFEGDLLGSDDAR